MERMKQQHMFDGSPVRGCSTISQQTAKNCFTFCSRTWFRKGIEAYFTVLIEKIWGKRVMCIVADAEVGCDVEKIGRCSEKIAKRYFSKQEIQQIDSEVNDATKAVLCTKIWCLKESFGKLTGLGLGGSLEKTSFDLSGDKVVLTDRAEIECSIWENDGYIYSYCLEGTVQ